MPKVNKKQVDPLEGVFLITCCTSTRTVPPIVRCSDLSPANTMSGALREWLKLLNEHEPSITPSELYRGVGFHVVMRIQELLGIDNIRVLTGGQGLLRLDTKIVPYDFTANKNHPGNILEIVTAEPFVIPLWWQMINQEMRDSQAPVADILDSSDSKLVVIALNKFFMRYLHDDLLSATPEGLAKLRIIVTGKSRSGIPVQLRPYVIQCPREVSAHTVGNRNDINHRAALHFIKMIQTVLVDVTALPEYHQAAIGEPTQAQTNRITPNLVLTQAPQLLTEYDDPDSAFAEAKRLYGAVGGIVAFRADWYRRTGKLEELTKGTKPSKAAISALGTIKSTIEERGAKVTTHHDTGQAYKYMAEFVATVRAEVPTAKFNASDIFEWVQRYCEEAKVTIPSTLSGVHKIAQFLSGSSEVLGLRKIKIGQGGSTLYQIK